MKRILVLVAMLIGCGKAHDRAECAASTDCPIGQYCAHTVDGNVCWADTVAPSVSNVTITCSTTPCVRDAVLHVEADVSDDHEVLEAAVSLDLDPSRPVPLTQAGGKWVADVPLRAYPFDAFAGDAVVTVSATDGARTSVFTSGIAVPVTRLRWTYDAGAPITSPAVMDDGTAVVGVSATSNQVLAIRADGTKAWSLTVGGTSFVTAAPAIGQRAIWVGSEDFALRGINLDGSGFVSGASVNTSGVIKGTAAVLPEPTKEWGFVSSQSGRLGAASTGGDLPDTTGATDAFAVGPVIATDGRVYAATAGAPGTVRSFTFDGAFTEKWSVNVGANVSAPIAIDASGNIWTGSQDAKLHKTVPADASGAATLVATLPNLVVDSPVILANADVVVGDQSGNLHRYSSTGTQLWSPTPNLSAPVLAPLVIAGATSRFIVPTKAGTIHAIRDDGSTIWSTSLDATELRAGNIYTPPGQAAPVMSTAYFSGVNGKLYTVIVDGQLDAAAPWPKAFHDPKNTNRAGPQP